MISMTMTDPTDHRDRALACLCQLGAMDLAPVRALLSEAPVRCWEKGEHLLHAGERTDTAWFLSNGLTRLYALDVRGREHVKDFHMEGMLTGSHAAAVARRPSAWFVQALEPSVTVALDVPTLEALAGEYPEVQGFLRAVAERLFWRKEEREIRLLSLTARQHYLALRRASPTLLERVPQRHIAAYLGITESSLSRVVGQLGTGGEP